MDHSEAIRQVYLTTRTYLIADGDRDAAIDLLAKEGYSEVAAALRTDLVPMAFGWALLNKMGVKKFPSYFELSDTGEKVKVSNSHVFTAALGLAVVVFENGYTEIFSKRVVEMLIAQSPEVDALNKALNAEPEMELSEVSFSSSLFGCTDDEYKKHA